MWICVTHARRTPRATKGEEMKAVGKTAARVILRIESDGYEFRVVERTGRRKREELLLCGVPASYFNELDPARYGDRARFKTKPLALKWVDETFGSCACIERPWFAA